MTIAHRQMNWFWWNFVTMTSESCPHLWHDLWPRRCHIGVTRVKKVNLAKSLLLLQFTWYCHVTHAYGSPNVTLYTDCTRKKSLYRGHFRYTKKSRNYPILPSFGVKVKVKYSPRSNFKQRQMAKLMVPTCCPWTNMQKYSRWPLRPTYD